MCARPGLKLDSQLELIAIDQHQTGRLAAMVDDHHLASEAADSPLPWLDAASRPGGSGLAVLPLRWGDTTEAVLVLGLLARAARGGDEGRRRTA